MKQNTKLKNIIFQISAILILLAAIVYYFRPDVAKYIIIAGVIGYTVISFTTPYPGKSLRGKRLFNIQIIAVLLMCVSAYLMFVDISGWVVTLLIAAILTLYSTVAISMEYKKEQEQEENGQK
ncbi:hypothetical protein D0T84_06420 [Dysgonomonas sp. 521]|uniref:hypothetical protein n=1 Tax=Dysgonomonas sp. 521 TaxID=2302932 RepID=UPI0013D1C1D2|nr:hypothetical protein [Dysgonomonas sp. 521]NDV94556.1 hypothetical protein [Dysgonomonas sp. 521]